MTKRAALAAAAAALAFAYAAPASATSLQVSPTNVELGAGPTATVTLTNVGKDAVPVQVRVFRWTQKDGQDDLVPATDLIASPPQADVPPGAAYTLRLVSRGGASGTERAYRLLIDELPQPTRERAGAVNLLLRYSVPVFAGGSGTPGALRWTARLRGGAVDISAANSGGQRVRLSRVKVGSGAASVNFGDGLLGYVLAGNEMTWSRPARGLGGGTVRISGESEGGPFDVAVPLSR